MDISALHKNVKTEKSYLYKICVVVVREWVTVKFFQYNTRMIIWNKYKDSRQITKIPVSYFALLQGMANINVYHQGFISHNIVVFKFRFLNNTKM